MNSINFGGSSSHSRRLPIYLVVDISGSMSGAPIQSVNTGIGLLYSELMSDPSAIETVYIGIITFESQARMNTPLTELTKFKPPTLSTGGGTSLGAALTLLGTSLDKDIIPNSAERKGDYKPLVFLLTDGEPTDEWMSAADALKTRTKNKVATIIALGCGPSVNVNTLKRITEIVLMMETVTPDKLNQFFQWVSQSVKTASQSAEQAGAGQAQVNLTKPPAGIQVLL